jgi:hypothetical protein
MVQLRERVSLLIDIKLIRTKLKGESGTTNTIQG